MADLLCTAHAGLRDRYARRALVLDVALLLFSVWVVSLSFVDPAIGLKLTPFHLSPAIWTGFLGIAGFAATLVQMKVDWKGRADAHKRAFDIYAEVKREAGYLLAGEGEIDLEGVGRVLSRYDLASALGVGIPEADFLRQKRRHLLKIAVSRHLDGYPSSSVGLLRLRWWWRDNFAKKADLAP